MPSEMFTIRSETKSNKERNKMSNYESNYDSNYESNKKRIRGLRKKLKLLKCYEQCNPPKQMSFRQQPSYEENFVVEIGTDSVNAPEESKREDVKMVSWKLDDVTREDSKNVTWKIDDVAIKDSNTHCDSKREDSEDFFASEHFNREEFDHDYRPPEEFKGNYLKKKLNKKQQWNVGDIDREELEKELDKLSLSYSSQGPGQTFDFSAGGDASVSDDDSTYVDDSRYGENSMFDDFFKFGEDDATVDSSTETIDDHYENVFTACWDPDFEDENNSVDANSYISGDSSIDSTVGNYSRSESFDKSESSNRNESPTTNESYKRNEFYIYKALQILYEYDVDEETIQKAYSYLICTHLSDDIKACLNSDDIVDVQHDKLLSVIPEEYRKNYLGMVSWNQRKKATNS